jgi:hypothetical protein
LSSELGPRNVRWRLPSTWVHRLPLGIILPPVSIWILLGRLSNSDSMAVRQICGNWLSLIGRRFEVRRRLWTSGAFNRSSVGSETQERAYCRTEPAHSFGRGHQYNHLCGESFGDKAVEPSRSLIKVRAYLTTLSIGTWRAQSKRITEVDRVPTPKPVRIQSTSQPDRVFLRESTRLRIVRSVPPI